MAKRVNPFPKALMSSKETSLLKRVLSKYKSKIKIAVELGSFEGGTSIVIANNLNKKSKLYCVDCFVVNRDDSRPRFMEDVLPNFSNMKLLERTTHEASQELDKQIDFLLIDADHQDHSIQEDLNDWLPKVKSGGLVAFHDYGNAMFPSIVQRVDEHTPDWKVLDCEDTLMIKIKP